MVRPTYWLVAVAALTMVSACSTEPTGPSGLTTISGSVVGYGGGGEFPVAAVTAPGPTSGATGNVLQDPTRLEATFVPLADMPQDELAPVQVLLASSDEKLAECDVDVSNAAVRIALVRSFRGPGDVRLTLQTYAPDTDATAGDRAYAFVLATGRVRLEGSCGSGNRLRVYDLELVRGWNVVAESRVEIEGGEDPVTHVVAEPPHEDAVWWYVEPALEKIPIAAR